MREGDVYRWYYKNDEEYRKNHQMSGTAYWCLDNQCVVKGGKLYDTYWCRKLKDFGSDCRVLHQDEIDLDFICNLNDVDFIHKGEKDDYDKVYNLSYQKGCRELFAVGKGVGKSKTAIKTKLLKEIGKAEDEIRYLKHTIEYNRKQIEELGT